MANQVNAQVSVYTSTDGTTTTYQFLPSSYVVAQTGTIVMVTLTAVAAPNGDPPPQFVNNSISQTTAGAGDVAMNLQSPMVFACRIDNSNSNAPTGVRFAGPGPNKIPPFVIDSGGTIRDKGTSIFKLVASAVLGLVGGVLAAAVLFAR
ncbi:MAG TPA: hypothetical protein VFV97_06905 [Rhodanobacteraceae bacterium]|nr:hypothetical protein [Rhodanobacteraceae bacterium]